MRRRTAVIIDERVDQGVAMSSEVDEVDTSVDHRIRKSLNKKKTAESEVVRWGMDHRIDNIERCDDVGRWWDFNWRWRRFCGEFTPISDLNREKSKSYSSFSPRLAVYTFFVLYCSAFNKFATAEKAPPNCRVDSCAQEFTSSFQVEKVTFSSNIACCTLLMNYTECLRRTSRTCRGNLRYHSLWTMVTNSNRDFNCTAVIAAHKAANKGFLMPPVTSKSSKTDTISGADTSSNLTSNVVDGRAGRCLFPYHHQKGASGYRYCAAFGDPHLRTFDGQHETCKTVGAWPLLDNAYLNVQLMNEVLVEGLEASGITKITVIVKALPGCTEQKTYTATKDSLPSAFDDGTEHSGEPSVSNGDTFRYHYQSSLPSTSNNNGGRGDSSRIPPAVFVQTMKFDEQIEIHLRYVSTRVVIRRVGNFLNVGVKMPEDALTQESTFSTWQLCLAGCPSSEKINYKEILAYPDYYMSKYGAREVSMTRDAAVAVCRDASLTDFFFDSCVFDLLTTGDASFKDAAAAALEDIRHLYPPYARHYETNRSDLRLYDELARLARDKESDERQRFQRQYSLSTAASSAVTGRSKALWTVFLLLVISRLNWRTL